MTAAELRAKTILERIAHIPNPVVCEIGVFIADLSRALLEQNKNLILHMVDPWSGQSSEAYKATGDYHARLNAEQQATYRRMAFSRTSTYGERAIIHEGFSHDVSKEFEDEMFDLVFIDADHSYEGCKQDIQDYWPKVKKGGYLGGHDYDNHENNLKFGVKDAVDEMFNDIELDLNYTWYVVVS